MVQGPFLLVILAGAIVFIVVATSIFKLHPFIALLVAAYGIGLGARMPLMDIDETISRGFGDILATMAVVILLSLILL